MHPLSKPKIDLTGQRFGRLKALSYVVSDDRRAWLCECDCGQRVEVRGRNLRIGKTSSCGCFKRERMAAGIAVKHGMTKTATYKSWNSMIGRCTNPADPSFDRYGGAGITVCEKWKEYPAFLRDMGERPAGTTLDRIDVKGAYEPGNCRWASPKVQGNNRANNRRFVYQGENMTIRQICDATGADYLRMRDRMTKLGWSLQKALETPVQKKRSQA